MLKVTAPRETATVYTRHYLGEVDNWSISRGGRSAVLHARGSWLADVRWEVGMGDKMAMTVDDFLLEFGIHDDGKNSEEQSGEESLEGGTASGGVPSVDGLNKH